MDNRFLAVSDGLKHLAVAVSVFKALGWLFLLAVTVLYRVPVSEKAWPVTMLVIGAALLFFQCQGATLQRPRTLWVTAVLMTFVDAFLLLRFLRSFSSGSGDRAVVVLLLVGLVFVAQLRVMIMARPLGPGEADGTT